MAHYLLSVYTPADGTPPTPEELDAIMKEVAAYNQELRAPAPGCSPAVSRPPQPRPSSGSRTVTC